MQAFAPTRFPKLVELTEAQVSKLSPVERAEYLDEKTHQDLWGHLPPQHHVALRGVPSLPDDAVENHARTMGTDPVHFAATKAFFKWGIGQEMSVEEYDAAIEHVLGHGHGY